MQSFTVIKSRNSRRYYVYNCDGTDIAQLDSFAMCLNYFYEWCVKLSCKSVTFAPTIDPNVICVKMN